MRRTFHAPRAGRPPLHARSAKRARARVERLLWVVTAGSFLAPFGSAGCTNVSESLRAVPREEEVTLARPQGRPQLSHGPIETPPLGRPLALEPAPLWAWDQTALSSVVDGQFHGVFEVAQRLPPSPRWLRIEVQPEETLGALAARYGVTAPELASWNRSVSAGKALRYGTRLRVHAQHFPRHRSRLHYWAQASDTWQSVAAAFGLEVQTLQGFNAQRREQPLRRGQRLTVWAESALPLWGHDAMATEPIEVVVPAGATSRGLPTNGSIVNGQRLPESALYTLKSRGGYHASTQTMAQLQRGIASFRRRTGFAGEVLISSASKAKGGRFPPHLSHQSGRDLDLGLVAFPIFGDGQEASESEVDWGATWALISEFVDSGQVEFVFLAYSHQKKLYEAAQAMGASEETLQQVFQYPQGPAAAHGMIRYSPGHERHFHIRFRCGPADRQCRSPYGTPLLDSV